MRAAALLVCCLCAHLAYANAVSTASTVSTGGVKPTKLRRSKGESKAKLRRRLGLGLADAAAKHGDAHAGGGLVGVIGAAEVVIVGASSSALSKGGASTSASTSAPKSAGADIVGQWGSAEDPTYRKLRYQVLSLLVPWMQQCQSPPLVGNMRTGMLRKLDVQGGNGSEDWISQDVELDVTTGVLSHYTEIVGKRILRGRYDINLCSVRPIDHIYHSAMYSFRIAFKADLKVDGGVGEVGGVVGGADGGVSKQIVIFSAEDEASLLYWFHSFLDCEVSLQQQRREREREEEEREQREQREREQSLLKQQEEKEREEKEGEEKERWEGEEGEGETASSTASAPAPITEHVDPPNPHDKILDRLAIRVTAASYPAQWLARRVRIWYLSAGFSLTQEQMGGFVGALRASGDAVLCSFADAEAGAGGGGTGAGGGRSVEAGAIASAEKGHRDFASMDWAALLDALKRHEMRSARAKASKIGAGSGVGAGTGAGAG
ncbi:hypothetical protein B484DRAFT_414763, partial [Ochromonadaceae sp. CCMP2298]